MVREKQCLLPGFTRTEEETEDTSPFLESDPSCLQEIPLDLEDFRRGLHTVLASRRGDSPGNGKILWSMYDSEFLPLPPGQMFPERGDDYENRLSMLLDDLGGRGLLPGVTVLTGNYDSKHNPRPYHLVTIPDRGQVAVRNFRGGATFVSEDIRDPAAYTVDRLTMCAASGVHRICCRKHRPWLSSVHRFLRHREDYLLFREPS